MILPAILDPFAERGSPALMTRLVLDWILDDDAINRLFDEVAVNEYIRELTLAHLVQAMLDVALGHQPSPHAAFLEHQLDQVASVQAFYGKLNRMRPALTAAVVRQVTTQLRRLIAEVGCLRDEPIPGYAARILDGTILTGTEHRIVPLRGTRAAGLPGMALAVYEPASMMILDVVLDEDAYCQERALLDQILIEPGQLWIADRNLCVRSFLSRIHRAGASFLMRRHAMDLPFRAAGPLHTVGRCETGQVFEQPIVVDDPDSPDGRLVLRRIVLELDEPTREGEAQIELVTDLPAEVSAIVGCTTYRGRWQIEGHFQDLTDLLHCEVPSLGHPRAALFAFSMSAIAGNALAVLKGSLRVAHGEEMAEELSDYYLVHKIASVYPGMMEALAPEKWSFVRCVPVEELAAELVKVAARMPMERMFRHRRGPKRPRTTKRQSGKKRHHYSNYRLLEEAKATGPPKR